MANKYSHYTKDELAERLSVIQEISVDLLKEKDPHNLLELIVTNALRIMVCDSGSLYLRGEEDHLIFEVAKNSSVNFEFKKFTLPTDNKGVAVYTFNEDRFVNVEDVYKLPEESPFKFDKSFDEKSNYRTKSVLTYPLERSDGEVIGVIQLINRKKTLKEKWPSNNEQEIENMPSFNKDDEGLLGSFAALASAAIENSQLHKEVHNLLEGFVRASVNAIEVRDTATCGHSERVAELSCQLALAVDRSCDAHLRHITLNTKDIKELEYASLLHDFGKIGVKEEVLLKSEKLYPIDKLTVESRLRDVAHAGEIRLLRNFIERLHKDQRPPSNFEMKKIESEISKFREETATVWENILKLNKTAILDEQNDELLQHLSQLQYLSYEGSQVPVITEREANFLAITKGSLNDEERQHINSHVSKTYEFLSQIPWTQNFKNVADIAHAHHEKLDGTGYPLKLTEKQIPVQSKIMTIIDIFDALVAMDRPYKKAVPLERALDILGYEVKDGKLDKNLFNVFLEAKIYESERYEELMKISVHKVQCKKAS